MKSCFVALVLLLGISQLAFSQGFGTIVGTVDRPVQRVGGGRESHHHRSRNGCCPRCCNQCLGPICRSWAPAYNLTLTVEASGFNKYSQSNIGLTADQSETVNVTLTVGQETQAVTVEAPAIQADTYSSTLKEVVDSQRMVDLPLNGRNAANLTTMVPGAMLTPNGGADQGQTKTFPGAVEDNDQRLRQNMVAYNLDGADNVDRYTNVNNPFPFPDALQEFSVQTSNYSAEYGGNAGAVVNVITKSGTNAFHGDVFGFIRNGDLNARNFFAKVADPLKRGQEGGTIGGPIKRNKTFFFAGWQFTSLRDVTNGLSKTVPTPAEEVGNFTGQAVIYDPKTGLPFPGNIIPQNRIDPASQGVIKFLPTSPAASGIVFYSSPVNQNFNDVVGHLDQIFSDKDHASVRYDWQLFTNKPVYDPTNILSYADGSDIIDQNILAQETHIFTPSLLNEFRAGFLRDASIRGPASDVPSVRTFGVNIPYQPPANDVQTIAVTNAFTFGDNPHARFTRNNFIGNDAVRWVVGQHNLAMGFDLERRQVELDNGFNSPGLFTFTGQTNHTLSSGSSLADFVLGDLYQFQQAQGQFENANAWMSGYFIHDDWKISKRLTLNMGLRWEPYFPYHEVDGRVEGFSIPNYYAGTHSIIYPNAPPGLVFRGDPGFPTNGTGNNFKDWSPRTGFAWDVFGDGRTSLRGGIGMFYDSGTNGIFNNNMVDEAPFAQQILITNPGQFSNPLAAYPQLQSVFPATFPVPKNVVLPGPVAVTTFNLIGNLAFKVPVVYSWNLTMEHQFGGWLARGAYVGSHASHLSLQQYLNPSVYIPGSTLSEQARVLFTGYSNNMELLDESGNSNYNSLQLTIQKRLAHGFSILANYTWQHSLDTVPPSSGTTGAGATGGAGPLPIPWYLPGSTQLDYGTSDFNRTQVFVVSYLWDIPSPHTTNKFVKGVVGNWELSGIVTKETGLAYTVFAGKDVSQTGLNQDRAQYLGGDPYGTTACKSAPCVSWMNTAAFGQPAAGTVGNIGKGAFTGPGLFNWDMGLFKNILITERWRAQLRGEFFNTFNHANFTSPLSGGSNYPVLSQSSSTFGTITSANDPRIIQIALKVVF